MKTRIAFAAIWICVLSCLGQQQDIRRGVLTGGSGGGSWGSITGTLSSQADLQSALNAKLTIPSGTTNQVVLGDGSVGAVPGGGGVAGTMINSGTPSNGALPQYSGTTGTNMTPSTIVVSSGRLTSLVDPSAAQDAATKGYVDSVAAGLSPKGSVMNATTTTLPANVYNNGSSGIGATLTATNNGALVVDGVTNAALDRILVKNEATAANNGIYVVTQAGSGILPYILTRSTDNDQSGEFDGAFVFVESGTVNVSSGWVSTTTGTVIVGTTPINWTRFSTSGPGASVGTLVTNGAAISAGDIVAYGTSLTNTAKATSVNLQTALGQVYQGTNANLTAVASGGGNAANWNASGSTNSTLAGNASVNAITATNASTLPLLSVSALTVGSFGIAARTTLTEVNGSITCDLSQTNRYWNCSPTGNIQVILANVSAGNWGNVLLRWPATNCTFNFAFVPAASTTNWFGGAPTTGTANRLGSLSFFPIDSTTNSTLSTYIETQ